MSMTGNHARPSYRPAIAILFLVLLTASFSQSVSAAGRPNIILIMADDMGYSDIGCFGGEINTPHLNQLADDGLRFTQFYNNAKCTTTRVSLLTGLYPRRKFPLLKPNMVTIGEVLQTVGYQTILSGKWHLGSVRERRPSARGFHKYFGLLDGASNFFNPSQPDPDFKGGKVRFFAHDDVRISKFDDDFYMTDAISDYAVSQIKSATQNQQPFFLHVCYTAPHYPLHAKPADIARYRGKYREGWDVLRKRRHQKQIDLGIVSEDWILPGPDPEVRDWASNPNKDWEDLRMAVYAAMVDCMDQGIGRILNQLKASGVDQNTIVMFLSDNGGCAEIPGGEDPTKIPGPKEYYTTCGPGWAYAQNTPFRRYKQWTHEGGISTPLIVRWPGVVKPGGITRAVGHIIDLLPTCAEVAGAVYPATFNDNQVLPVEGTSLFPLFKGKDRPTPETLFWEWKQSRAVRQGDWKLSWDRKVTEWELYDIANDRTEMNNLVATHPDKVQAMSAAWQTWAQQTGVKVRKSN